MRVRAGTALSIALHAAVIVWAFWNFASVKPRTTEPTEALPIDLVTISDVTKSKAGQIKAEKRPEKQAEKKSDPAPTPDLSVPVKQKEVKATPPPPTPVEEKVAKKEEPKPEEVKPDPSPSPDAIQKKLEETKKQEQKKEAPKKVVKKAPPVKTKHDFNPNEIAALLDRKQPSRKEVPGEQKTNPNFGVTKGEHQSLSATELEAFRRKVESCWSVLPGAGNMERVAVELHILLNPDGSLAGPPRVVSQPKTAGEQATAESAIRAVIQCAPYKMLQARTYPVWKDMILTFDPRDFRT
jgi:outer membrane biosynthesis protein TonB